MKFPQPIALREVATLIHAEIQGNADGFANGINEIHRVEKGDLVFVDHPKYYKTCIESEASFIIINQSTACPPDKVLLIVEHPFEAYLTIVRHFQPFMPSNKTLDENASIGEGTYIAPNAFIGPHVRIGKHCRIHPNVCIMGHSNIGDHVVIQSGTVIGSDAFYYNGKKDREIWYRRMESCGEVIIGDAVEIGAGCTIDRGVTHQTVIGKGTKIDNQVHIGHDVVIGNNCLLAAQVGIAGGTVLGNGVILWGQVGVNKTISIGDHAIVMGQSGVTASLEGGKTYMGTPAEEAGKKRREFVWIKRIPEMWEQLRK